MHNLIAMDFLYESDENLQLEIIIKHGKFNIFYSKSLLKSLRITEDEFSTISDKLREIIDPSTIIKETKLVSLFLINTKIEVSGMEKVDINQEVKIRANNKDFKPEIYKKVSYALLEDIFLKMGVDKDSIRENLG